LPDLKPFADATTAMASAMRQGYAQTEGRLARAGAGDARLKELRDRWEPTRKAVVAIVAYSDALAALGDAGAKGEESAGALISSLEGVQQAVGALIPGLPAIPAGVTTAFRKINGVIAKIRARRALKEVVGEADDALRAAADILSLNFRSLSEINRSAAVELRAKLAADNFALRSYHDSLAGELRATTVVLTHLLDYQSKDKIASRDTTVAALRAADADFASQLDARLRAVGDAATPAQKDAVTLAVVVKRQSDWDARVKYLQGEMDRIAHAYDAYVAELAALREAEKNDPIAFSGTVIEAWAAAHSGLRSALGSKQRLTLSELTSAVNELVELAEALKKDSKEEKNGKD
jgi:hypothetical protein